MVLVSVRIVFAILAHGSCVIASSDTCATTGPDRDYPETSPENKGSGDPQLCQCISPEQLPHKLSTQSEDKEGKPEILLNFDSWKAKEGKLGMGTFTRPHDFGTFCGAHDAGTRPECADHNSPSGIGAQLRHWCEKPWCFVSKECACGKAATSKGGEMTLPHAIRTAVQGGSGDPVYFSYQNCDPTEVKAAGDHHDAFCEGNKEACEAAKDQCWNDAAERSAEKTRPQRRNAETRVTMGGDAAEVAAMFKDDAPASLLASAAGLSTDCKEAMEDAELFKGLGDFACKECDKCQGDEASTCKAEYCTDDRNALLKDDKYTESQTEKDEFQELLDRATALG